MKLIHQSIPLLFMAGLLFANTEKNLQTQFILAEPINIVTNIPLDIVSQISLFNCVNKSAGEKFVLLRQLYKLEALDI